MFKVIKPDNNIFNTKEFQKDKAKFNLILKNLPSPFLGGSKKWPTWIWTKDNFD